MTLDNLGVKILGIRSTTFWESEDKTRSTYVYNLDIARSNTPDGEVVHEHHSLVYADDLEYALETMGLKPNTPQGNT